MNLSLNDVLQLTGGKLIGETPEISISGVNTLSEACSGDISFLGNEKYFQDFLTTKASAVLVPPALPQYPEGPAYIEVENPSLAFNALVGHFMKAVTEFTPGIHPTAVVDPTARLNPEKVCIGPNAVIEGGVSIGDGTDIGPGCVIGKGVEIGENCKFYARVVVRERCIIGNKVVIQPGAVIGGDGFGFLLNPETGCYDTIDQVGIVVLEDNVDIGANTTIDRARFGRTVIGEGSKIDNLFRLATTAPSASIPSSVPRAARPAPPPSATMLPLLHRLVWVVTFPSAIRPYWPPALASCPVWTVVRHTGELPHARPRTQPASLPPFASCRMLSRNS